MTPTHSARVECGSARRDRNPGGHRQSGGILDGSSTCSRLSGASSHRFTVRKGAARAGSTAVSAVDGGVVGTVSVAITPATTAASSTNAPIAQLTLDVLHTKKNRPPPQRDAGLPFGTGSVLSRLILMRQEMHYSRCTMCTQPHTHTRARYARLESATLPLGSAACQRMSGGMREDVTRIRVALVFCDTFVRYTTAFLFA